MNHFLQIWEFPMFRTAPSGIGVHSICYISLLLFCTNTSFPSDAKFLAFSTDSAELDRLPEASVIFVHAFSVFRGIIKVEQCRKRTNPITSNKPLHIITDRLSPRLQTCPPTAPIDHFVYLEPGRKSHDARIFSVRNIG